MPFQKDNQAVSHGFPDRSPIVLPPSDTACPALAPTAHAATRLHLPPGSFGRR